MSTGIVKHFLSSYFDAADRKRKTSITNEIVSIVLHSGRFLKKEKGQWTAISNEMARIKVAHCLQYEWRHQPPSSTASAGSDKVGISAESLLFETESSNYASPTSDGSDEDRSEQVMMEMQVDPFEDTETTSEFGIGFDPASLEVKEDACSTATAKTVPPTNATLTPQGLLVICDNDSFYDKYHLQRPRDYCDIEIFADQLELDNIVSESLDEIIDDLSEVNSFMSTMESSDDTQLDRCFYCPDVVSPSPGPEDNLYY